MVVFPKAKINIGLWVTSKRDDGFHNIETIFYLVPLCDALEVVSSACETRSDSLKLSGFDIATPESDNIIMEAIEIMRRSYTIPYLRVHLHKAIPSGAGLGGGSSDAASMLKILCRMFSVGADEKELSEMALELGSDSPFFIRCEPSYATGRGENLSPMPWFLNGYYLVMVNPGVGINTAEAYRNCKPLQRSISLTSLVANDIREWKDQLTNDFEEFAFKKIPLLGKIKGDLYSSGALYSAMSGSGSTIYGIFASKPELPAWLSEMIIYSGNLENR